jgi:hypothetical protein
VSNALAKTAEAVRVAPDCAECFRVLGVAQYRAGKWEDALASLARSTSLDETHGTPAPVDLAFTAMAHFKLGHTDEARSVLASLERLIAEDEASGKQAEAFAWEARTLIESGGQPES